MQPEKKEIWFIRYRVGILTTLGYLFSTAVATVVAIMSWNHIVEVGRTAGEPMAVALPVAVDGLMLTGTVMAAVDRIRGYKTRVAAILDLWFGSLLTISFNMASALGRFPVASWRWWLALGIAALCAVTLLLAVETMFHPSQRPLQKTLKKVAETLHISESPEPTPEQPTEKPAPAPAAAEKGRPGRKPGHQPNQPDRRRQAKSTFRPGIKQRPNQPIEARVIPSAPPAKAQMSDPSPDVVEGEVVPSDA